MKTIFRYLLVLTALTVTAGSLNRCLAQDTAKDPDEKKRKAYPAMYELYEKHVAHYQTVLKFYQDSIQTVHTQLSELRNDPAMRRWENTEIRKRYTQLTDRFNALTAMYAQKVKQYTAAKAEYEKKLKQYENMK